MRPRHMLAHGATVTLCGATMAYSPEWDAEAMEWDDSQLTAYLSRITCEACTSAMAARIVHGDEVTSTSWGEDSGWDAPTPMPRWTWLCVIGAVAMVLGIIAWNVAHHG